MIELGVPYSDPLADGPVIQVCASLNLSALMFLMGCNISFFFFGCGSFQAAATRALKKGATFDSVIAMLKGVIPELSCPIVIFTYYNPILKRGVSNFMAIIKQAGVHGNFPA